MSRHPAKHDRRFNTEPSLSADVAVFATSPSPAVVILPASRRARRYVPTAALASPPFRRTFLVAAAAPAVPPRIRVLHSLSRGTESVAMPSFTAPSVSGFAPRTHRTHEAALGLSLVPQRPASASTRPVYIRSRLTPACSGLATLATDARR